MATYGSIPQTEGEQVSPTPEFSNKKKGLIVLLFAVIFAGIGAKVIMSPDEEEVVCPEPQTIEATEAWPSKLFSGVGSLMNAYKGTGELGTGTRATTGRPTTTKQATKEGWKKVSDSECEPNLGHPWAFNGEITEGAPVTLYFSKETECVDGVLTGMGVHYFNSAAPTKMIEYFIFSKGKYYDTIKVAFRNEDTDVCSEGLLPSNNPVLDVILAEGKGRKHVPVTEADAKTSGEWKAGACLGGMGIHWEHDIVGGSNFTFEAENFYPIVPMYDVKDGSLNGIFFQAPKTMQVWDVAVCGANAPTPACLVLTNLWDAGQGLFAEGKAGVLMASNFCGVYDGITGTENGMLTTMHFFFKDKITACNDRCPKDDTLVY